MSTQKLNNAVAESVSHVPSAKILRPRVNKEWAKISRISHLSHDTIELVLSSPTDQTRLRAKAGQFCTIKVPGIERPRAYSLARAPEVQDPGQYTFLIRLLADGELSQWLLNGDRVGETIELAGPLGNFVLDDNNSPMVCIAGGSGMSAIFAIIESAQAAKSARDCFFFYGARMQSDLYLTEEIEKIKAFWHSSFQFEFVPVLSAEPEASNWAGARGLVADVAVDSLKKLDPAIWKDCCSYLCCPPLMIDAALSAFARLGVSPEQCHFDRFEDASFPAPVIDNRKCVLCDECLLVKPTENCIVEVSQLQRDSTGNTIGFSNLDPGDTSGLYYNALLIDESQCIRCNACVDVCPHGAISHENPNRTSTVRQPLP